MADSGTYEATVERSFTAAHALAMPGGNMEQSHEHQWHVTAVFRSRQLQQPMGVVVDFIAADGALADVLGELDGRNLEDLPQFSSGRSSAELVARWIAVQLAQTNLSTDSLYCVRVTEAAGCTASYYT